MTNYLLALLYSALGLLIVAVEVYRMRAGRSFDALSLFNGAYFLFFVFVPLNVLVLGEDAVRQKYAYQTWSHGDIWTALALVLSYIIFVFGYYRRGKCQMPRRVDFGAPGIHAAIWLIGFFFLIGGIALAYHVSLVGGVIDALKFAPGVRTGQFPLEGRALFVRQFASFLATAFMLAWALYIDAIGKIPQPYRQLMLALLGFAFVYYALSTFGRREFLYPIIICIAIWVIAGQRRLWGGLGWLLALCMLWLAAHSWINYSYVPPTVTAPTVTAPTVTAPTVTAPTVTAPTVTEFLRDSYLRLIQGLGDSFMHFVAAQNASLWQFGFLSDIWELPLQFVPSQVLGFERPRGMFGETSAFILGKPLEPGRSGEEPLGLHGYLLVNFSYAGMFLVFYLMGRGYRVLDAVLKPEKGGSATAWLIYLWAVVGALEFLREGVLVLVIKPRFSWWLAIGILLWFKYRSSVRDRPSS